MTSPTELEEPHEAALRIALGLRPTAYEWGDPVIDPRPCPSWYLYGEMGEKHDIEPRRPFDVLHVLGAGPDVALSRYPTVRLAGTDGDTNWYSCASLELSASQSGSEDPIVRVSLPMTVLERAGENGILELALPDAHELRTALTYILDVLEGRREPVKDAS
ncbi:hypothetical protein [Nocardioides aurantiacus]|nr:hypothetical protein [Nocardioides aurantiacus]